jgi:hypothetical protein
VGRHGALPPLQEMRRCGTPFRAWRKSRTFSLHSSSRRSAWNRSVTASSTLRSIGSVASWGAGSTITATLRGMSDVPQAPPGPAAARASSGRAEAAMLAMTCSPCARLRFDSRKGRGVSISTVPNRVCSTRVRRPCTFRSCSQQVQRRLSLHRRQVDLVCGKGSRALSPVRYRPRNRFAIPRQRLRPDGEFHRPSPSVRQSACGFPSLYPLPAIFR